MVDASMTVDELREYLSEKPMPDLSIWDEEEDIMVLHWGDEVETIFVRRYHA